MASTASASSALLLALSLLLFAVTSACPYCGGHGGHGHGGGSHGGSAPGGGSSGGSGGYGGGSGGGVSPIGGGGSGGGIGPIGGGGSGGGIGPIGGGGPIIGGGGPIIGGGGPIIGGGSGGGYGPGSGGGGYGPGSGGGGYGPGSGGGGSGGTTGWYGHCPTDALKLAVCANVLDLIKAKGGAALHDNKCCPLLNGLVELDAAVCLCTAIKANILGINLNLPINLSLVLNFCGKGVPTGFKCA